jgi:ABC-2 type transport system permease protein
LFTTELQVLQFLIIISTPIYISSGFSWPFDQDGWAAQMFSCTFPFMPFVNGMRILLMEGGTLSAIRENIQLPGCQATVYFLISYILLKIRLRKIKHKI